MITEYRNYLKDNPQGYWFKRKLYGWGWVPVRWQGWATLLVFVAYLTWVAVGFAREAHTGAVSNQELLNLIGEVAIAVALLIYVCYRKGEEPKWQWGIPKE